LAPSLIKSPSGFVRHAIACKRVSDVANAEVTILLIDCSAIPTGRIPSEGVPRNKHISISIAMDIDRSSTVVTSGIVSERAT
jgi:hypothetical protein